MRIQDVHVEVRGKNLDGSGDFLGRQGTILNRDLNLQAKTRWCGVGEWELTLPGGHPMVPYLMQEGSGLVVNGPVGQTLVPREYSAWTEEQRNYARSPFGAAALPGYAGYPNLTLAAENNTGGVVMTGVSPLPVPGHPNSALYVSIPGGAAVGGGITIADGLPAGDYVASMWVNRRNGPTTQMQLAIRGVVGFGPARTFNFDEWVYISEGFTVTPAAAPAVVGWRSVNVVDPAQTNFFVGNMQITKLGQQAPQGALVLTGDTPDSDLVRYSWAGAANASSSFKEVRSVTREPYYETDFGVLFSGPTLVPNRKRDIKNPDGTLTFKGVTDEIHLEDALAFPSPTIDDPEAQTRANDDQAGPAETLLRYYVNANLVTAPPARKGGFRDFVTIPGADTTLGESVAKSPRFQNLLELCQEIATTSLVGYRMVQSEEQIQFQIVPTRDLRKTVRLDIDSGTLNSEETQFQPWSLTRALVAGQGEGTARKIRTVTTPEATASELSSGRIIERWVNQSNTNDDAELETKGLEELADAAGGTAAKAIPADTITMQYGRQWREGDWITVIIDGEERDSVVTEAVFSFTKDLVGIGVALGDVSSFKAESAERKQARSLDARVAYMERAGNRPALSATGAETLDWNQATENGNYWGNGAANAPYAGMVMGQVLRDGDGRIVQEALDPSNLLYGRKRRVMSGGVWGAWKPVGDAILPAAWVGNGTSSHAPAAGTGWSSIPGALRLELPAYDRDLLVDVDFGAIGSASTGYWMIGASVFEQASGPWSIPIENADPQMVGTLSTPIYGLYAPYSQTAQIVQISGSKPVVIPAGVASVFQMATRKSVSAAAVTLNYSSMQVKPVRWI